MKTKKTLVTTLLYSGLLLSIQSYARVTPLEEIVYQFKRLSLKGYHLEYYGSGKLKGETKFEGDIRLAWTNNEFASLDSVRIKGTYHIRDILGKRDDQVDIYLVGKEYWNLDPLRKEYDYSPNIEKTLWSAFNRSPLMVFEALSFFVKHSSFILKSTSNENSDWIKFTCNYGQEVYTIWVNEQDYSIQKVSLKKEGWEGEQICAITSSQTLSQPASFVPKIQGRLRKIVPTIGYMAPKWSSTYYGTDQKVSLNQFKGKVVLMDFWATWCPPCLRAIPSLEIMNNKYKSRGVTVLGMNYMEKRNPLKTMQKFHATYPTIMSEQIGLEYGILNWPTVILIDKFGIIRDIIIGFKGEETEERISSLIDQLLIE